jgi:hypothetical protein
LLYSCVTTGSFERFDTGKDWGETEMSGDVNKTIHSPPVLLKIIAEKP